MDPTDLAYQLAPLKIGGLTVDPVIWASVLVGVISFLTAYGAILFVGHRLRRAVLLDQPLPDLSPEDDCAMVFLDRKLWSTTDAAKAFLAQFPDADDAWTRLGRGVAALHGDLPKHMEELADQGTSFAVPFCQDDGAFLQIQGQPRGRFVIIRVVDMTDEQIAHSALQDEVGSLQGRLDLFAQISNGAPLLMWCRDAKGVVSWANANCRKVIGERGSGWTLPEVLQTDCKPGATSTRRSSLHNSEIDENNWFEVLEVSNSNGNFFGYAGNIDNLVHTEAALQRFISTLTETFAQLPVGLSIFDAKRTLNLFNPALIDLLGLDPARLAKRPSLREFFDTLRENRLVPGQKNFEDWRQYVFDIQDQAEAGTLREKLVLATGRTFEVTGKPHPHGAIALIFEDITPMATLEQRFRSEIELSQATLDRLSEAVAVFDTSGALVFANVAFSKLWGFDPMEGLEPIRINAATGIWIEKCLPTPVWGDLRDFATRSDNRSQWDAEIELQDGRMIHADFSPLPDGSTLLVFSDITDEERTRANFKSQIDAARKTDSNRATVVEAAIERIQDAVQQMSSDLSQGVDLDAKTLLQTINNALRQSQDLLELDHHPAQSGPTRIGSLFVELGALAEKRGLELDISMPEDLADTTINSDLRRLFLNLVVASGDIMKKGAMAQLSVVAIDNGLAISCLGETSSDFGSSEDVRVSLPLRLLERIAERLDGTVSVAEIGAGRTIKLACSIPDVLARPELARTSQETA